MTKECIYKDKPEGKKRLERTFRFSEKAKAQSCDLSKGDGVCHFPRINNAQKCPLFKLKKGEIDIAEFIKSLGSGG